MKEPGVLYKYFPKTRVDVLVNLKIKFTAPKQFNDPFEFLPRIEEHEKDRLTEASSEEMTEILRSLLRNYGELIFPDMLITKAIATVTDDKIEFLRRTLGDADPHLIDQLRNRLNNAIGVLSLSANRSNPVMWSHYSENHSGFIVGFRTESLWTSDQKKYIYGPVKVNYAKKQPVTSVFDSTVESWFAAKQSIWEYEDEYRFIASLSRSNTKIEQSGNTIHLYDFHSNAVSEIIAGLRTPKELKQRLRNIRDAHLPNARFLYSQITEDEIYRITFAE